ncbi:MAG: UPF0280 family protein [Alphaproteobacteria bacterium]|nr:UPF0280 family protein [Alphaproteobacteria bacterium]
MSALASRLADGRLHLQHGPIDLIIEAFGAGAAVEGAYHRATARFGDILDVLVRELNALRQPVGPAHPLFHGPVARRMAAAVWPYREVFITPMAAVAGAVADEILTAMIASHGLAKAYVNNGGDIAFHLAPGESLRAGVIDDQDRPALDATVLLRAEEPSRGLATSGWRGRSLSLGIADAVTVLARDAAAADAAATLIANQVDVDHPAVERRPAREIRDDSDLGDLPVTVAVGPLSPVAIAAALDKGARRAEDLRRRGLIHAAYLALQGERGVIGVATSTEGQGALAWTS